MLIFAHRGASFDFPENTLAAFNGAIQQQADGIELDIYQHQKELIVVHDCYLDRTTNGKGHFKHYLLHDLLQLDAGNGECIPSLWQVLTLMKDSNIQINIEIKHMLAVDQLIRELNKAFSILNYSSQQFIISSFNHRALTKFHQQMPAIRLGALTASIPLNYTEFAIHLGAYSVHLHHNMVTQQYIDDAHEKGLKVFIYTVDNPEQAEEFASMGVDGLFTNKPQYIREVLYQNSLH